MGRRAVLVIACCVLAYASIPQGVGWNQNAHYALVRSLADGHAYVDRYHLETGDVAWYHGHYYAAKAPGLALLTTPVYLALRSTGALHLAARLSHSHNPQVGGLWALGLVGSVLPAALILLLVRRLGDELEPGYGLPAAVTIGLGSLILPFATLFFNHLLSAALGLAAFAVAVLRRDRAWLAGLLAGLAIVAEYTLGLAAVAVGLYVLWQSGGRRFLSYVAGGAVGILPLVLFNQFAFGSPFHVTYEDAVAVTGRTGHDVLGANSRGFFGVGAPSFHTGVDLLFSHIGLLTLAPVAALGAVGWLLTGRRAEAAVALGLAAAFLVFNSGYVQPFGGFTPGPRFLIPILPLLGIGLAPAYRRLPLATLALAVPSVVLMVAVTITGPVLAHDGRWFERISNGHFLGHGVAEIVPFCVLVAIALVLAARSSPRPSVEARGIARAAVAFAGWLLLALFAHRLLDQTGWSRFASAALVLASALAVAGAAWLAGRARLVEAAPSSHPS